jgi:pimeloyl-ACP methyl ester carboxylesterase
MGIDATAAPLPGVLRTPEACFSSLPAYPWTPHYTASLPGFEGLRVHYLDEGPRDAQVTVLCLHGQPTWSYLYRKMLPVFVAAGQRVIAPDLLALVRQLDLRNLTLVVQDWGGLLGLTLPMDVPGIVRRLVVMNTTLGTGDVPLGKGFTDWRAYANSQPDLDLAKLMARSVPGLSAAEAQAYAAPFPDARYKAGVRRFPNLVPDHPDADGAALSRRARQWWSRDWEGDSLMAMGLLDPVLGAPTMAALQQLIQRCPAPLALPQAGHFVQEHGEVVASAALQAFGQT